MALEEPVIVFGHSFVRSCQEMCEEDDTYANLGLNMDSTPVYWCGQYAGEDVVFVHQIKEWLDKYSIYAKNTHLMLVDLASNDVKGFYNNDGVSLACEMFTRALELRDAGVKRVAIFECLERDGLGCVPRRLHNIANQDTIQSYVEQYNTTVSTYNDQLSRLISETNDRVGIEFLKWKGIHQEHTSLQYLCPDGIHLRDGLKHTYWLNLRRNCIRQCKKARDPLPVQV